LTPIRLWQLIAAGYIGIRYQVPIVGCSVLSRQLETGNDYCLGGCYDRRIGSCERWNFVGGRISKWVLLFHSRCSELRSERFSFGECGTSAVAKPVQPARVQVALGRQHSTRGARAQIGSPLGCRSIHSHQLYEFFNRPNMIGNACFHRRRNAQTTMDTGEVVVPEMQCQRGSQVLFLLGERIR
jgi:hypothetical protein